MVFSHYRYAAVGGSLQGCPAAHEQYWSMTHYKIPTSKLISLTLSCDGSCRQWDWYVPVHVLWASPLLAGAATL